MPCHQVRQVSRHCSCCCHSQAFELRQVVVQFECLCLLSCEPMHGPECSGSSRRLASSAGWLLAHGRPLALQVFLFPPARTTTIITTSPPHTHGLIVMPRSIIVPIITHCSRTRTQLPPFTRRPLVPSIPHTPTTGMVQFQVSVTREPVECRVISISHLTSSIPRATTCNPSPARLCLLLRHPKTIS